MKPEDVQLNVEAEKRISEIRERESKATKGPWHVDDTPDDTVPQFVYDENGRGVADTGNNDRPEPEQIANAEYISHARQDIPFLLAYIVFLLEQLALLRCVSGKGVECEFCYDTLPSHRSNCRLAIQVNEVCDYTGRPCLDPSQVCKCEKCQAAAQTYRYVSTPATTQGTPEGAK